MVRLLDEADRQIVMEYLAGNGIETAFLYGNIVELGITNRSEVRRCGDYYGYFDARGRLKGILPFINMGSCLPHFEDEAAVPLFIEKMKERTFRTLMGMSRVLRPLYLGIEGSREIGEFSESSYFINKGFKPYEVPGLEFVEPRDRIEDDEVIAFIMRARKNGFHETVCAEEVRDSIRTDGPELDKVIAVMNGKMVAYAIVHAYTETINQIGSVYTIEDERGKGYCKAVVSEVCRRIEARRKMPTLFVVKKNTRAVRGYTSLGFENYDDYLIVRFA